MRYIIFSIFFVLISKFSFADEPVYKCFSPAAEIIERRIPFASHRYITFCQAFQFIKERNHQVIVETGTATSGGFNCLGYGCSTLMFAEWLSRNGGTFYSVDIDLNAVNNAAQALGPYRQFVQFVCGDSVTFLKNFNKPIDFLYLDSFDFVINDPLPSQMHHLKEIEAAYPLLSKNSVVMIDDCDLPHGGKGKFAIEFLLEKGWKIFSSHYQVILVHPDSL